MAMEDMVPVGSPPYFQVLGALLFARGMDFISTWVATPNLLLEANPLARKLGWRLGLFVNAALCLALAAWPLPAIVIMTTSLLVAARNFQSAWLMRALGEKSYRDWLAHQLSHSGLRLYLFCLGCQGFLIALPGVMLVYSSPNSLIPFAVGLGIIAYALAVVFYTLLSLRRFRG